VTTPVSDQKVYPLHETPPQAVVIHCSDPHFQPAFRQFVSESLHLHEGEYLPLIVPGGAASLSEPLRLPEDFKFMKERLEFFLDQFKTVNRVIVVNHEDCPHYRMFMDLLGQRILQRFASLGDRQKADLTSVGKYILELAAPGTKVELYFARIIPGTERKVVFDRMM
jgi:hypothetical protein